MRRSRADLGSLVQKTSTFQQFLFLCMRSLLLRVIIFGLCCHMGTLKFPIIWPTSSLFMYILYCLCKKTSKTCADSDDAHANTGLRPSHMQYEAFSHKAYLAFPS